MSTQPPDEGGYYTSNFHPCNWCGEIFSSSSVLIIHQRYVCGYSKIHQCPHCRKIFPCKESNVISAINKGSPILEVDLSQSPPEVDLSQSPPEVNPSEDQDEDAVLDSVIDLETSYPSSSQTNPVLTKGTFSEYVTSGDSDLEIL